MKVTAFAPATSANVAVGFDVLGFALEGAGDEVTVELSDKKNLVKILKITGLETKLPVDAAKNTAGAALISMQQALALDCGFEVSIHKGIAMGSGMGGSAASAVAAVVAAHELLVRKRIVEPLSEESLLQFSLDGEKVASGSIHGDNVGPCLKGGLTLVLPTQPMRMVSIPTPADIFSVVVHPDLQVETRGARSILKREVSLTDAVYQSSMLAALISGCYTSDLSLIQAALNDIIIEPQRSHLIPGFAQLKAEALSRHALGFSISGSGPSVFAWVKSKSSAIELGEKLIALFKSQKISAQFWVSKLNAPGAEVKTK